MKKNGDDFIYRQGSNCQKLKVVEASIELCQFLIDDVFGKVHPMETWKIHEAIARLKISISDLDDVYESGLIKSAVEHELERLNRIQK